MTTTDNSTITAVVSSGIASTAVVFFRQAVIDMIPWMIVAIPLIVLDLNFGIKAARFRGEQIRFSKAFRRTFGKTIEYAAWICFAATATLAFGYKWIEVVVLGAVILNEVASVIGNYFESKGLKLKWGNILNTLIHFFGKKHNVDTEGIDVNDMTEPVKRPRDSKGRFVKKD